MVVPKSMVPKPKGSSWCERYAESVGHCYSGDTAKEWYTGMPGRYS